jgi:hypothetical protein
LFFSNIRCLFSIIYTRKKTFFTLFNRKMS